MIENHRLERVVSGGQTGIDQLGLEVAHLLGIPTGGIAPKGYLTENGPDECLKEYGLTEHCSTKYPARTRANVQQSDGTVLFGQITGGTKLTLDFCEKEGKPYCVNPNVNQLREWLRENQTRILNVAGSRGSSLSVEQLANYKQVLIGALASHVKSGDYPALTVSLKTGEEPFLYNGLPLSIKLFDFWRWSASDLANNVLRGRLAEYIVAQALDIATPVQVEWDTYDLLTSSGIRIEVKSAAYLQSWYHKKLSSIKFSIRSSQAWNAELNAYKTESKRQADVYVFCLLAHQEKQTLDPLNLNQWAFYVLATSILNSACGKQKTITLPKLRQLGAKQLPVEELAGVISRITSAQNELGVIP